MLRVKATGNRQQATSNVPIFDELLDLGSGNSMNYLCIKTGYKM
jgi:hypothetical protein